MQAEGENRAPKAQCVSAAQAAPSAYALLVDERAVARGAVVHELPMALDALEPGVLARDLIVLLDQEVARWVTPHRDRSRFGIERELPLVGEHEKCPTRSVGLRAGLEVIGGRCR